ncbi:MULTISPECIES: R3H domain-containing nucleic acid-binding protein [unclassified Adlercreutzia]|uniref:Jag family protein n=1 Tax=unclassified Adlercreutzia TaxID=2636013 RepID=UPI001F149F85|nr:MULTISPECIES: R3H domain-containing nucleic acid-binding protein [unclassified Adlercreutzia]
MTEEILEEGGVADAAPDALVAVESDGMQEAATCDAVASDEVGAESDSVNESAVTTPAAADEQEITDEMLDNIADTAIAALQDILKYFNVGDITIDEYEGDEGELILDITGDDLAVLIGRHGKTLDALQFLVSAITVRTIGFRYPVVIDVEGYKSRQRQKLESIARSSANRAVAQHHEVKLRPMTPYERRIVHITLRDDDRVATASEGEGGARRVVITPR